MLTKSKFEKSRKNELIDEKMIAYAKNGALN